MSEHSGLLAPNWRAQGVCVFEEQRSVATAASSETARRLVAAVNACRGIATEELESGVIADLLAHCDEAFAGDAKGAAILKRVRRG